MQSRMDRYNNGNKEFKSRTQKNSTLYDDVKNSMITEFDVNSNMSVISSDADDVINVGNVKKYLDDRYSANSPKRKSIEIPDTFEEREINIDEDTKEYDINAILKKAKLGKNVDYTKERLKKVRDTQYEILNNLDLELKKVTEPENLRRKEEEQNLMNLINTITQLELCNKNGNKEYTKEEISSNLDLLSDLSEKKEIPKNEEKKEVLDQTDTSIKIEKINTDDEYKHQMDFTDISVTDKGTLIIKIIIFIVIIVLIFGAVYICNNILDLGLFN